YNTDGPDAVSISSNQTELEKEGIRLAQASYFLDAFKDTALERNVDIGNDICITDFLPALQIIEDGEEPCPASGLTSIDIHTQGKKFEHGEDSHHFVAWLLEECRQTCTHKWSGTNQHPSHNHSQVGNVITAFVHFVYLYSHKSVVLANIQSKSLFPLSVFLLLMRHAGTAVDSKHVIFDLMSHAVEG
ncbi:hypothetical protein GYMLUDRAFT_1025410, partial [Collybiopsis luxurians FD-317 M1]